MPIDHKVVDWLFRLVNLILLVASPFALKFFVRKTIDADPTKDGTIFWHWLPGLLVSFIFWVWQFAILLHYLTRQQP